MQVYFILTQDTLLFTILLPGLSPQGVPSNLKGTVFPFDYNEYEQLEKIVCEEDIGIIKMEVIRNEKPKNNFLKLILSFFLKKKGIKDKTANPINQFVAIIV